MNEEKTKVVVVSKRAKGKNEEWIFVFICREIDTGPYIRKNARNAKTIFQFTYIITHYNRLQSTSYNEMGREVVGMITRMHLGTSSSSGYVHCQ